MSKYRCRGCNLLEGKFCFTNSANAENYLTLIDKYKCPCRNCIVRVMCRSLCKERIAFSMVHFFNQPERKAK